MTHPKVLPLSPPSGRHEIHRVTGVSMEILGSLRWPLQAMSQRHSEDLVGLGAALAWGYEAGGGRGLQSCGGWCMGAEDVGWPKLPQFLVK